MTDQRAVKMLFIGLYLSASVTVISSCLWGGIPATQQKDETTYTYVLRRQTTVYEDVAYSLTSSVDWQPGDRLIAIAGNQGTFLYDVEKNTIRKLKEEPPSVVPDIRWSFDGRKLAGNGENLWVWDSLSDQITFNGNGRRGDLQGFESVHWSPDSQVIMSDYRATDSSIWIWDLAAGTFSEYTISNADDPLLLDWSSDGKYLALASLHDARVEIVDYPHNSVAHSLDVRMDAAGAAWSPDSSAIVTEDREGNLAIWSSSSWRVIATLTANEGDVWAVRWRPDGHYLAFSTQEGVSIWNISNGTVTKVQSGKADDIDWNSTGTQLVTVVNNQLYIWAMNDLP